ncbi:hypothetical protein PR202_ga26411 [Eleusine coracana subsp. coracana]|uniref:non-specific serine/threonine protein kinase n=1 Tax=Eleusine coracana subsp. coracana TaxID=191504 RepID=A0AAV5DEX0_ELECO|nr:hypothetical protein QOZ80_3BG0287290 [Eleusine coracana subsp. coracana]GJN08485.1 hypothetical protein PR202_ga26411 [Eleusine coracana subsp. coracana]
MQLISCVVACLFLLASSSQPAAATGVPAGTLQRVTKQHILASIPPHWDENPVLFLTSPSGKYAAYFVRTQTTPGAGGLGADFCFVQVLDTSAPGEEGRSVWESDCMAVSTVNTCALVFSWEGLEVFDGSNSVWHTQNAESDSGNFLETLQLVDQGDMRILDKGGELAWKASDQPRAAQHCGMPGSPGLNSPLPTFAEPVGTTEDLPFGAEGGAGVRVGGVGIGVGGGVAPQPELPVAPSPVDADQYGGAVVPQPDLPLAPFPAQGAGQFAAVGQGQVVENVGHTFGFGNQPLVDNSPYDSGAMKNGFSVVGFALALGLSVAAAMGLGL